uniref:Hydrophobin n=1 Tax=Dictyonema glabratum TaxID=164459 RepID=Q8WZJ1_9AGAR|nr:hydrophobin 3 [Dictyonema glabratum]
MLIRITAFTVLALTTGSFVAALPSPALATTPIPASQCNTGPVQCCQSISSSSNSGTASLLGPLGLVLSGLNIPIGVTCTPISLLGIGGNSCSANPVCCQNNNFNGVVAVGCTPVNLSL